MKKITDELLLLIALIVCIGSVVGMKVIYDINNHKETKVFTCNTIMEVSDNPAIDLAESGCFDNLDFINNL